jgi:hypothetical protein
MIEALALISPTFWGLREVAFSVSSSGPRGEQVTGNPHLREGRA